MRVSAQTGMRFKSNRVSSLENADTPRLGCSFPEMHCFHCQGQNVQIANYFNRLGSYFWKGYFRMKEGALRVNKSASFTVGASESKNIWMEFAGLKRRGAVTTEFTDTKESGPPGLLTPV